MRTKVKMKEAQNTDEKTKVEETEIVDTDENAISDLQKESTRKYIAMLYVIAFFVVIAAVFIVGVLKCFSVDDYKDMLITVSGILSGPLGFIVGYYFKASKE